jgi:lipoprotein NlpD
MDFPRALVLLAATLLLGACTSSVVREISPGSGSSVAVSKPGESVTVRRGDTLYAIAFRSGVDMRDLARWNGLSPPYTIYPDQRLRLFPAGGSTVAGGTTSGRLPPTVVRPPTPVVPAPAPARSGISWRWPADGQVIQRFAAGDATKQGVDIGGSSGQAVRAAADGVVVYSGAGLVGYGELVIIKHSDAWLSAYGHNRKRLVNEGQNVKSGQQIAEMGRSGAAREMLHFEIRHNGKPVDPLQHLPGR